MSLWRFAHRQRWLWFGATLGFFTLSSAVCVMYWMTHYPAATLDQDLRESRSKFQRFDLQEARVHGVSHNLVVYIGHDRRVLSMVAVQH